MSADPIFYKMNKNNHLVKKLTMISFIFINFKILNQCLYMAAEDAFLTFCSLDSEFTGFITFSFDFSFRYAVVLFIFLYILQQFKVQQFREMGKKQWSSQEIQLLESIKLSNNQKNWKMISKLLTRKGYKRTQQECRHKWVNCLSPDINHGPWTDEQLSTLYSEYEKNLSRWSVIQKFLPNRTQIKIKNHFYGVLRNIVRFVLKHFQRVPGKQTQISNRVNPNSLKSLFWGEGDFEFLRDEVKTIIRQMKYRFNKQKLWKIISEKQKIYKKLNQKILEQVDINIKLTDAPERNDIEGSEARVQKQDNDQEINHNSPVQPYLQSDQNVLNSFISPYNLWPQPFQFGGWQLNNTLQVPYIVYYTGGQINYYDGSTDNVHS